ncbi:hypothetical protein [Nocardia sp. NPDC059239]|uniref:hypothetical protein n=1 Tax=Nocardia sp. NPDC059239 TaxID=3346785 RepID=UPI0036CF5892
MPAAIDGLPRDHRGYPVPAESRWANGDPQLAIQDHRRFFLLHAAGCCAICGCPFRPGDVRYRLFADGDARAAKATGGCRRSDGPGHRECMLFSAAACPFFATAGARAVHPTHKGLGRGAKAAVFGFQRVQMFLGRDDGGEVRTIEFVYDGLCDELWFRTADQVVEHLKTAMAHAPHIDVRQRQYWSSDDTAESMWQDAVQRFKQKHPLPQP